jgi:hypothetical protein
MIRVTVELCSAITGKVEFKMVAKIVNDGKTSRINPARGSYECQLLDKNGDLWSTSEVHNFPRKNKHVWYLVGRAIWVALAKKDHEREAKKDARIREKIIQRDAA